jgi:cystathionine gamma-synthase
MGGHSDVVGGALVLNDEQTFNRLKFLQNAAGGVPGPFDSWLVLRGLKTLALRMRAHSENGLAVASFLEQHPAVEQLFYPGLSSHPQHVLAARQMRSAGGMISFLPVGGEEAARKIVTRTKLFTLAESLGGVESLIELPSAMTHASVAGSPLEVPAGLVRLSVGIEDVADLIADLDHALRV